MPGKTKSDLVQARSLQQTYRTNISTYDWEQGTFAPIKSLSGQGNIKCFAVNKRKDNWHAVSDTLQGIKKITSEIHGKFAFLTDTGKLFELRQDNQMQVVQVPIPNVTFKDIVSGYEHTYYIANDCSVYYSGGNNHYYQAATTEPNIDHWHNKIITALEEYKEQIIKVSSGGWNAYALLQSKQVIAWGYNTDNRCGIIVNSHLATPQFVKFDDDIIDISAGEWHSLALSVKGEVYAWGLNNHSSLTDELVACQLPAKIKTLPTVVKLFTTPHSTINVVKTASGAWYGWGSETSPNMIPTTNKRNHKHKNIQMLIGMDGVESVVCSPWGVFFFLEKHKASVRRIEKFSDVLLFLQQ